MDSIEDKFIQKIKEIRKIKKNKEIVKEIEE